MKESPAGSGSSYKFETWIPLSMTVGGLVILVLAVLLLLAKKIKPAMVALLFGLGLPFLGINMFFDYAVVDNDHFEMQTGFIFSPTKHNIRFDDVSNIEGVVEVSTGRRGRKNNSFYFVFTTKSGAVKVPLGDLMKHGPADKILQIASQRKIPVSGSMPAND